MSENTTGHTADHTEEITAYLAIHDEGHTFEALATNHEPFVIVTIPQVGEPVMSIRSGNKISTKEQVVSMLRVAAEMVDKMEEPLVDGEEQA